MTLPRWAIVTIAVVSLFRLVVASIIPLTEDEAYNWSWSLHPAFGYTEDPPMVVWLIAAFSFLGKSPLAIRLPTILCETLAAFAAGHAAIVLSRNAHAGAVTALIVTLVPQDRWLIGQAFLDPPYVCSWALAIWLAARVSERATARDMVLLGVALGGALLSRFFAWALVAGIACYALQPRRRALWSSGLWLALLIAVALYVPLIAWNATHGWENFGHTLHRVLNSDVERFPLSTLRFLIFAALFVLFSWFVLLKRRLDLLAWTALPLVLALSAVAFYQRTESYWLMGPFVSLNIGLGIAYTELPAGWRLVCKIVGGVIVGIALVNVVLSTRPDTPVHVYSRLANDMNAVRIERDATVLTENYEIAAELLYNGVPNPLVVDPYVIGTLPQVAQWRRWYGSGGVPEHAIFLTYDPLSAYPALAPRVYHAYRHVQPGPMMVYTFGLRAAPTFNITFCDSPRADAAEILFGR